MVGVAVTEPQWSLQRRRLRKYVVLQDVAEPELAGLQAGSPGELPSVTLPRGDTVNRTDCPTTGTP